MCVLCFVFALVLVRADKTMHVVNVMGTMGTSCQEVCEDRGMICYDNILEKMHCASAAADVCEVSSIKDYSNTIHCDKGGCYADCKNNMYADRGTHYTTCYSEPSCHRQVVSTHTLSTVCPCSVVEEVDTSFHIMVWQVVGVAMLGTVIVVLIIATLHYFFPSMFPTRESIYRKMGLAGDQPSFMDSLRQVPRVFQDCLDSIKNKITGLFSSVSASVEASANEAAESRRKRREKRARRRGQHSALTSEMDESMDMEIG